MSQTQSKLFLGGIGAGFWVRCMAVRTETRYAYDIEDMVEEVNGRPNAMHTINSAVFSSTRLLTLQTRLSAAYKGIMALLYKEMCRDFMNNTTIDIVNSMLESPDIHHIQIMRMPSCSFSMRILDIPMSMDRTWSAITTLRFMRMSCCPSLQRINKNLPMDALTEAIYKLKNFETGTLLQKNMVFMDYLQNGVPVKYYDKGEERSTLVYLVDFKNPASNEFTVANQWTFIENSEKKTRCDSLCQWSPTRHCGVEVSVPRRNRCFRSIPPAPELYV